MLDKFFFFCFLMKRINLCWINQLNIHFLLTKQAKLCGEGSIAEDSPLASDEECISIVEKADRLFAAIERNEIESPEDVEGTADIVNDIVGNITVTDNQTGNDDLKQKKKVCMKFF